MSLRGKAIVGIVVVSIVLMSGLVVIDRFLVAPQFDRVDEQETARDVRRAANAVLMEVDALDVLLIDWATWDDTYAFMDDRSPEYVASNLQDDITDALQLSAFIFVAPSGEVVVSRTHTPDGTSAPVDGFREGDMALGRLLDRTIDSGEVRGVVSLPEGPMMVAVRPILRTDGSGPPHGALIMGRWLSEGFEQRLSALLATPVRFDHSPGAIALLAGHQSPDESLVTREGDGLVGRALLTDLAGDPVLVVETAQQRDIVALRDHTSRLALGAVAATTLALMAVTLLVLDRGFLGPMVRLRQELSLVGARVTGLRVTVRGDDEVAQVAAAVNDMVERLQQAGREQARLAAVAREQEEVARAALQGMSEGFLVFDHDGRCQLCNAAAGRMLRVRPEDAVGRHFGDLLPARALTPAAAVTPGGVQLIDLGGRTFAVTRTATTEADHHRTVVLLRDVSDVLDVERLRRDIVQTVSHELRTPLTAIRATVDLFESGDAGAIPETQRRLVELLSRNTDRLLHIVNDLLALSALEGGHVTLAREAVDLSILAAHVADDLRPTAARAGVTLQVMSSEPVVAWADEPRLRQVMENLLQNAIKFSNPGGAVTLDVGLRGDQALVRVRDQGVGIPPEEHERIFEKFYRTQAGRHATGSGLGLPIARLLVELHGGRIWVESDGHSGTTMSFTVPVFAGQATSSPVSGHRRRARVGAEDDALTVWEVEP